MVERLEIEDFAGGVTDYYLNAPPNKMRTCDNFLLIKYPGLAKPNLRPGSEILYDQTPSGIKRIGSCFFFGGNFWAQVEGKFYYYTSSWQTQSSQSGSSTIITSGAETTLYTYGTWNNHTLLATSDYNRPQKIVATGTNTFIECSAGLPKIVTSGITITPAAGANNWLYTFVYKKSYTDKDAVTYTDFGTPGDIVTPVAGGLNVAISTIPVFANSTDDNYDVTTTLKVEIYRTTNNGTVFYRVGEVTNGTTVFTDTVTDAALTANPLLYTEGGVVANDRPPKCALVHVLNDIGYYANIKDATNQVFKYRLFQSIAGDIDSVPETFFVDVEDEIVSLSSTRSNVILLCRNSVYRIDGAYDEVGRGGMVAEKISDTASCVSAQGAVRTLEGVFWAGLEGIYFSDGYQVVLINRDYDTTYREFVTTISTGEQNTTKQVRIQGKYDKKKARIWWTIQHADVATDVDMCYVLDLSWGINENSTFTTLSGLDSFSPTAIEFDSAGRFIRGDRRGYTFIHKDTLYSDPLINTGAAYSTWNKQTIFYELETIAHNFGTTFARKYVTGMTVVAQTPTNLSLAVTSNNDDAKSTASLLPIRYRGGTIWGDPDVYWSDVGVVWGRQGLVTEKRFMPAQNLRCMYKSIKFENAYVVILTHTTVQVANIDSVAKTVTMTSLQWPSNAVGYYISFAVDNYTIEYLVTAISGSVLTYSDAGGLSGTATGSGWTLRGYPKDEVFNLQNYTIYYTAMGQSQDVFNNSDTGEVGS